MSRGNCGIASEVGVPVEVSLRLTERHLEAAYTAVRDAALYSNTWQRSIMECRLAVWRQSGIDAGCSLM